MIQHGYKRAFAITPDDSAMISPGCEAIYVGGTGDLAVVSDGVTATFKAVPVGAIIPIKAQKVKASGTTATLLVGLWGQ